MDSETVASASSLAPGFRFHPTDEELVRYYLRRKVCGRGFRFDAISEIDVYKSEPWDLPDKSRLKSRDLEWYFFSVLDKKYGNGSRTNRATERGYWKTTGKDRAVLHKSRTVGMKKTLVYHCGRAPRGERTNWVMHEYRLVDEELDKAGVLQESFVLCRIFQKSGTGPKNGEQYGAPFIEEEWEEDELVMFPGDEAAEEVLIGDDAYLNGDDLDQILDARVPSEDVPPPLDFYYEEENENYVQEPTDFNDEDAQKFLVGAGESNYGLEQADDQKLFELPLHNDMELKPVKHEYIGETSNAALSLDADYLLDEPYLDATENPPFNDGAFLETNDLSNPIEANPSSFDMLEEYLQFYDAVIDNSQYMAFDSSVMIESENLICDEASVAEKFVDEVAPQESETKQQLVKELKTDGASSSKSEPRDFKSDDQYPFLKEASRMLGSFPAPLAFASEYPTKDAALGLNSAPQSSTSVHVTAGLIQIRNVRLTGSGIDWLFGGKHGVDVSIFLSFSMPQVYPPHASLEEPMNDEDVLPSKGAESLTSRGWLYLMFFWVLILSMSFKIGTCFYSGKAY